MEKASGLNIEMSKEFNVPVERLYKAWNTEEDLRQWWHPMENTLKDLTNELQPGGRIEYTFTNSENNEVFTITGTYKEVEQGKRLVYTWNWKLPSAAIHDSEFLLTISFTPTTTGSMIQVRQDNFYNEEAIQPHREGWDKALTELQKHLNSK